jgi:hypothetical protein
VTEDFMAQCDTAFDQNSAHSAWGNKLCSDIITIRPLSSEAFQKRLPQIHPDFRWKKSNQTSRSKMSECTPEFQASANLTTEQAEEYTSCNHLSPNQVEVMLPTPHHQVQTHQLASSEMDAAQNTEATERVDNMLASAPSSSVLDAPQSEEIVDQPTRLATENSNSQLLERHPVNPPQGLSATMLEFQNAVTTPLMSSLLHCPNIQPVGEGFSDVRTQKISDRSKMPTRQSSRIN